MKEFISNFFEIFDETGLDMLSPDTQFRGIDEWSSLHALAALNMIELKYSIKLNADEMKKTSTIQDLYNLVQSKK